MLALILAATLDVWPGFAMDKIPVAIYDGKRTLLHHHPAPPAGFTDIGDGVFAYDGRHPAVTANSSIAIGGVETATVIAQNPTPALIAHEQFHVHQRTKHPAWSANEADLFVYPVDDVRALAVQRREFDALRCALDGDECALRLALALRRERYAHIGAAAAAYERGTELNEGLATYVEHRVSGAPVVLKDVAPEAVRERAYQTGLALATLLDRHDKQWRETLENGDQRSLDELLTAAIGDDARAAEDARAIHARREQRKRDFLAQPGWTIVITSDKPFFPARFDPLNVQIVAKGEVLHTRHLKLTGESGSIEILDRPALTESAGPHPLFNGVRRLTLTGFATKPRMEGDRLIADGVTAELRGAKIEIR